MKKIIIDCNGKNWSESSHEATLRILEAFDEGHDNIETEYVNVDENLFQEFYSIFDDPNEFRVYYKNTEHLKKGLIDCCFGC